MNNRTFFQEDKKEWLKEGVIGGKPGPFWIHDSLTGRRKQAFGGVGLGKGI